MDNATDPARPCNAIVLGRTKQLNIPGQKGTGLLPYAAKSLKSSSGDYCKSSRRGRSSRYGTEYLGAKTTAEQKVPRYLLSNKRRNKDGQSDIIAETDVKMVRKRSSSRKRSRSGLTSCSPRRRRRRGGRSRSRSRSRSGSRARSSSRSTSRPASPRRRRRRSSRSRSRSRSR